MHEFFAQRESGVFVGHAVGNITSEESSTGKFAAPFEYVSCVKLMPARKFNVVASDLMAWKPNPPV